MAAWAALRLLGKPQPAETSEPALQDEAAYNHGATGMDELSAPKSTEEKIGRVSNANTPRAYRQDAATHLYACNAARIYAGMLPPQLYAIGVLNVSIGTKGQVLRLQWLRAPAHAPEVVAEIERTVHAAAPFPQPLLLGKVVYTDTWLWDASGNFQLDTLTEGQL